MRSDLWHITNKGVEQVSYNLLTYEPCYEKPGRRDFRPGPIQTGLYRHRRWFEICNSEFRKKRDCITCVVITKALIRCAVTAQLICIFVSHMQKAGFVMTRLICILKLKSKQNSAPPPSPPKWETSKLTNRHNTKRTYSLSNGQLSSKMWSFS